MGLSWSDLEYAVPGLNTYKILSGAGGIKNALEGDPASYTKALQGLQATANSQAEKVKNFLLGREANAQQIYRPMQQMFSNMYGSGGMMPAKAPAMPMGGAPGGAAGVGRPY